MLIVRSKKACQGFSLIEVMISVFILSVGLLGVASMQSSSIKMNVGAYNQSQANILIAEMLDRMRLNRDEFLAGEYDMAAGVVVAAAVGLDCNASVAGCTSSQLASNDKRDFYGFFNDVTNLGVNFVAFIPGGSVIIARAEGDPTTAVVSVSWEQEDWGSGLTTQTLTMFVKI